jgi:hypothetical protein
MGKYEVDFKHISLQGSLKTIPNISQKSITNGMDFILVAGLLATAAKGPRCQMVGKYGQRYV